jgi:hypothetical protein
MAFPTQQMKGHIFIYMHILIMSHKGEICSTPTHYRKLPRGNKTRQVHSKLAKGTQQSSGRRGKWPQPQKQVTTHLELAQLQEANLKDTSNGQTLAS